MNYAFQAAYVVLLWWSITGLILYLNGRSADTFHHSLALATGLLLLALIGLVWSGSQQTVFGAYVSFTCGLLVYAWQELSYFMGFVTGPRKIACEPGCRGWGHFVHALQANIYHEIAILAGALVIALLCRGAPNQAGLWAYLILWGMQLSAKLNVFLGVRNLSEEFLPVHMQHLKSFLRQRSMNLLFPFSVTVSTILTIWMTRLMLAADPGSFAATSCTLLVSLMVLAVMEHWFLVLPFSVTKLWQGWLRLRDSSPFVKSSNSATASPPKAGFSSHGLLKAPRVLTEDISTSIAQPVGCAARNTDKTSIRSATC
jgi:putative photosynthetic complex assembly protein 2